MRSEENFGTQAGKGHEEKGEYIPTSLKEINESLTSHVLKKKFIMSKLGLYQNKKICALKSRNQSKKK